MEDNSPRLIGRLEAAEYLGIKPSTFSQWVATNIMPKPIHGTKKWDKRAIDARLDEISGLATQFNNAGAADDEYERHLAQQREREKHSPVHRLGVREERVLRILEACQDPIATAEIPQTGEKTMQKLLTVGVVKKTSKNAVGQTLWMLSDEGVAELKRIDTYRNWKFKR